MQQAFEIGGSSDYIKMKMVTGSCQKIRMNGK